MKKHQRPVAHTVSKDSQNPSTEHDHHVPADAGDAVVKAAHEARAEDGPVNKMKAVGRELDRIVGGEYEAREDLAGRKRDRQIEKRAQNSPHTEH